MIKGFCESQAMRKMQKCTIVIFHEKSHYNAKNVIGDNSCMLEKQEMQEIFAISRIKK